MKQIADCLSGECRGVVAKDVLFHLSGGEHSAAIAAEFSICRPFKLFLFELSGHRRHIGSVADFLGAGTIPRASCAAIGTAVARLSAKPSCTARLRPSLRCLMRSR